MKSNSDKVNYKTIHHNKVSLRVCVHVHVCGGGEIVIVSVTCTRLVLSQPVHTDV